MNPYQNFKRAVKCAAKGCALEASTPFVLAHLGAQPTGKPGIYTIGNTEYIFTKSYVYDVTADMQRYTHGAFFRDCEALTVRWNTLTPDVWQKIANTVYTTDGLYVLSQFYNEVRDPDLLRALTEKVKVRKRSVLFLAALTLEASLATAANGKFRFNKDAALGCFSLSKVLGSNFKFQAHTKALMFKNAEDYFQRQRWSDKRSHLPHPAEALLMDSSFRAWICANRTDCAELVRTALRLTQDVPNSASYLIPAISDVLASTSSVLFPE